MSYYHCLAGCPHFYQCSIFWIYFMGHSNKYQGAKKGKVCIEKSILRLLEHWLHLPIHNYYIWFLNSCKHFPCFIMNGSLIYWCLNLNRINIFPFHYVQVCGNLHGGFCHFDIRLPWFCGRIQHKPSALHLRWN